MRPEPGSLFPSESQERIVFRISRSPGGACRVLLAASLWGTAGTARTFAPAGASPVEVAAVRLLGGGLLLFLIALPGGALGGLVSRGARTRGLLVLSAAAAAAYQAAFFAATARTGVAVGTVVTIGAAPVFTGILSVAARSRSRPGARWLASTAAAVAGCVMLVTSGRASSADLAGIALALLAGFCYALYASTASYLITNGAEERAVIGAIFGGAAILLTPVLFASPMGWLATGRGLAVAVYLAVVTTAVAYLLYARGLRTTPVTTATTLGLAEPAVAAVLGLTLLREHLTAAGLAGLGILGLSLAILAWPSQAPGTAPDPAERRKSWPAGNHSGGRGVETHKQHKCIDKYPAHPS
jgi:drug/metabolite transporter, DME family